MVDRGCGGRSEAGRCVVTVLNELLARAWELITIGVLLGVGICAVAGLPHEFSGAPAEPEDDGEEIPYDPDRFGDWQYADEVEAL